MSVAPLAMTSPSSSGRSRLASSRMSMPSSVLAGPSRDPAARSQRTTGGASTVRRCQSARVDASPLMRHSPVVPSRSTEAPGGMAVVARATPTTAGTPSERARIAVCEAQLPPSVTKPAARDQSTWATVEGASSSATSTHGSDPSGTTMPRDSQRRLPTRRSTTSRTSPCRSRRYGSPAAPMTATSSSDAARKAHSALRRSSRTKAAARPTSIASSIISSCASNSEAAPWPATPVSLARIPSSCRRDRPCASVRRDSSARTRSAATR